MAKCDVCGQEMLTANGCKGKTVRCKGKEYKRIKVGDPGDFFEGMSADTRCGDCGAKMGYLHHWGCDCERCPVCKGQLISCECVLDMNVKGIENNEYMYYMSGTKRI